MDDEIREILRDNGRLQQDVGLLDAGSDLYRAGMTSHATVDVMLALETAFDVEFADRMLRRSTFESIATIRAALTELGVAGEANSYASS
jgi:acyl carrier protein